MAGKHSAQHGAHSSSASATPRGALLSRVLLIVGIVLLVIALAGFGYIGWQYWVGQKQYDNLSQYGMSDEAADKIMAGYEGDLNIDWASLRAINPDIVAWIKVPGTAIDYPVVQGDDNEYYLSQTFDGTGNRYGCIFLDFESGLAFNDYHSILYGHNMRNGSMFASFVEYVDEQYFKEHQDILLATPDGGTWHLKAVTAFVAEGTEALRQTQFAGNAEFTAYLQEGLNRCEFAEKIDVSKVTHLYTFATCSYQFNDARTIVMAVEVDKYGSLVSRNTTVVAKNTASTAADTSTVTTSTGAIRAAS